MSKDAPYSPFPEGWSAENTAPDEITIYLPEGGGIFIRRDSTSLASGVLFDLAAALLARQTKQYGGGDGE